MLRCSFSRTPCRPCAGCWPASPCAPQWAPGAGPCRPTPPGRKRTGTLGARSAGGGAVGTSPALSVATHHLAVDQAGPHLEVVYGLDHQREAVRPVIAPPGNQADANGIATGHQPVAVVLDLVNPTGPRRRMVGGGWQARLYEGGSTQHAAYLGGPQEKVEVKSSRERNTARRIGVTPRQARAPHQMPRAQTPLSPPLAGFSFVWSHACRGTQGSPWKRRKRKGPRFV